MKETLDQFIETVKTLKRCPGHSIVQRVYAKTHEGASLRRLMIDLIVWEGGIEYMKPINEPPLNEPPELVQDVMIGFGAKAADPSQKEQPWKDLARYLVKAPQDEKMGGASVGRASNKRERAATHTFNREDMHKNLVHIVFGIPTTVDLTGED